MMLQEIVALHILGEIIKRSSGGKYQTISIADSDE